MPIPKGVEVITEEEGWYIALEESPGKDLLGRFSNPCDPKPQHEPPGVSTNGPALVLLTPASSVYDCWREGVSSPAVMPVRVLPSVKLASNGLDSRKTAPPPGVVPVPNAEGVNPEVHEEGAAGEVEWASMARNLDGVLAPPLVELGKGKVELTKESSEREVQSVQLLV